MDSTTMHPTLKKFEVDLTRQGSNHQARLPLRPARLHRLGAADLRRAVRPDMSGARRCARRRRAPVRSQASETGHCQPQADRPEGVLPLGCGQRACTSPSSG
jgi:hypothetical protein